MPASLSRSRAAARSLTRQHAKTFYFASHMLPLAKRQDAYSVYAFCRYVDDQIDLAPTESARDSAFADLGQVLEATYSSDPNARALLTRLTWFEAFHETVARRHIPQALFEDLLIGMEMDCGPVHLETWPELERYCYHVASVVGLIMVYVLTEPAPELLLPARHLGTAMQLTNILRDIQEDWSRGRVYLPATELAKFGLSSEDLARQQVDEKFRSLLRFQIDRARDFYRQAQPGIVALPHDGSQLTVRLMSTIYGAILDEIERADYQVFHGRARVSFSRKLQLATKTVLTRPAS